MSKILVLTLHKNEKDKLFGGVEVWADELVAALKNNDEHRIGHWSLRDAVEQFTKENKNVIPPINPQTPKPMLAYWMNQQFNKKDLSFYDAVIFNSDEAYGLDLDKVNNPIAVCHGTYRGCGDATGDLAFQSIFSTVQMSVLNHPKVKLVGVSENSLVEAGKPGDVIHNGVDVNMFRQRDKKECREKLMLRDDATIALYIDPHRAPSKGWNVWLELMTKHTGNKVQFWNPPTVNRDILPEIYSAADYLVFPSQYEACPFTALEAMACDLPVIMPPVGCFNKYKEGFHPFGMIKTDWSKFNPMWYTDKKISPRKWVIDNGFTLDKFNRNWIDYFARILKDR